MIDYFLTSAGLCVASLLALFCLRSAPARWRLCMALATLPIVVLPWFMLPPIEIVRSGGLPLILEVLPALTPVDMVEATSVSGAVPEIVRLPWLLIFASATVIGCVRFVLLSVRHRTTVNRWADVAHDGCYLLDSLPVDSRVVCRIKVVSNSDVAVATGFLRPTVWLGERHLTHQSLQTVLIHELVHVRRQHTRLTIAVNFLSSLLWWHPFAWVWSWIVNREIEYDCDEACTRQIGKERYRNSLAALTLSATPRPVALGLISNVSFNVRRLRALEKVYSVRLRHGVVATAWAFAIAAFVVEVAVVAEEAFEAKNAPSLVGEHDDVLLSPDKNTWWRFLRDMDGNHVIRLAPNAVIQSASTRVSANGEKAMLTIAGQEQPSSALSRSDRAQPPGEIYGTMSSANPSLELACSSDLESAEATVKFHTEWQEVTADDAKEREGGVLEIRTLGNTSTFYRKPLHDGTTGTVEYRFDSKFRRVSEVALAYRVDLRYPGDWQSFFNLDAEAVDEISARTQRPDELTLIVSNEVNGYHTGKISFDLASSKADLNEFFHRCDDLHRPDAP